MQATSTPYEYVGDIPALGSLQLTQLANSYEQLESQGLEDLFPDQNIEERTILIETVKEGLGIMPIVQMGKPAGSFLEPERVERRYVQPAVVREDDFFDQSLINQLREVGTLNTKSPPLEIIQRRIRRLVNRRNRTKMLLQSMVLQGGVNYTDPRTQATINVSTQIPVHNYFRYDGWDANLAADAAIVGTEYTAHKAFTDNKGRKEALLFTTKEGKAGVPFTHPQANIIRTFRLLKQYLHNTNKNKYTDLVMSRDLYTIIEENELIQALQGGVGVVVQPSANTAAIAGSARVTPPSVTFGAGGEITSLAGLNIRLVDSLYRDPVDNVIKKLWPNNLIAMVAKSHHSDRSSTLGLTHHPVGEAPDGTSGMWMRTGPDQMPPAVPGRTVQMGDAFLPFAVYPQWIALLTVAETTDVETSFLQADLSYGTF